MQPIFESIFNRFSTSLQQSSQLKHSKTIALYFVSSTTATYEQSLHSCQHTFIEAWLSIYVGYEQPAGVRAMVFNPDGRTVLCAMQDSLKVPCFFHYEVFWEFIRFEDADAECFLCCIAPSMHHLLRIYLENMVTNNLLLPEHFLSPVYVWHFCLTLKKFRSSIPIICRILLLESSSFLGGSYQVVDIYRYIWTDELEYPVAGVVLGTT